MTLDIKDGQSQNILPIHSIELFGFFTMNIGASGDSLGSDAVSKVQPEGASATGVGEAALVGASGQNKRRAPPASVTPGRSEDGRNCPRRPPSTREQEYVMNSRYPLRDDQAPVYMVGSSPELFLVQLRGGIDLIYCNQGAEEGFVHSFVEPYFYNGVKDSVPTERFKHLRGQTGIFAMVARRKSRVENVPQFKIQDGKVTQYSKCYFVRMSGANGGSDTERMAVLRAMKTVSCASREDNCTTSEETLHFCTFAQIMDEQINKRATGTNQWRPRYVVIPGDWNKTPSVLCTWDEYMLDSDIGRIMGLVYNKQPDHNFAQSRCCTKDAHFSPPYSIYARENFGFGAVHTNAASNAHR